MRQSRERNRVSQEVWVLTQHVILSKALVLPGGRCPQLSEEVLGEGL